MRPWALPFILLAGLVTPSLALASLPPCCYSTVPSCVSLVGAYGAVPAADGEFTVVIRDFANNPVAGAVVVFDLSNAPDMSFCSDQLDPAATVNCAGRTVSKVTAVDGSVRFTLLGGSNGAGNAISLLSAGRIFANGYLMATPTVSAFDLDGANGVGASDLSAWLSDFGTGQSYGRSDYDCNGTVGAGDLSLWLTAFGSGTMATSCGASCP